MVVEFGEEGGEIRSTQLFSSYIKTGEEESWPQLSPKKILPSTEKFSRHGSNRPLKLYFVLYSRKGEKGRDKSARISSLLSLFPSPLSLGSARLGSARRNVVALPPTSPSSAQNQYRRRYRRRRRRRRFHPGFSRPSVRLHLSFPSDLVPRVSLSPSLSYPLPPPRQFIHSLTRRFGFVELKYNITNRF